MIRAVARKGGVIHINFACDFLNEDVRRENPGAKKALRAAYPESMDALRGAMEKRFKRATLADVVAHIDHAVKIGGIESVGLGSDFDGIDCTPVGLEDVSKFPNLTQALLEKGYTPEQIGKIYGENTLRVMREVERVARQMQKH
jgi:membrane dipeptidase